jgi:hypothetical protein
MAAQKTTVGNGTVVYTVIDAHGNGVVLKHLGPPTNAVITIGTASNFVVMTKANVTDLLTPLTTFSTTGLVI